MQREPLKQGTQLNLLCGIQTCHHRANLVPMAHQDPLDQPAAHIVQAHFFAPEVIR
jgi:hypothetical protein